MRIYTIFNVGNGCVYLRKSPKAVSKFVQERSIYPHVVWRDYGDGGKVKCDPLNKGFVKSMENKEIAKIVDGDDYTDLTENDIEFLIQKHEI